MDQFTKYEGLGNDFVVIDRRASGRDIDAATANKLCDRHFGVGADGVLTILPAENALARMVVHNADGSTAEMCGNGLRCVVKHLAETSGAQPHQLSVATGAGVLPCELHWGAHGVERVTISMGGARLSAPHLPSGGPFVGRLLDGFRATAVSMGNPHLVLLDAPITGAPELGPRFERHPLFVERTNVEFFKVQPDGELEVVVFERGVGLTLACGTGACAAVVAAALDKRLSFDQWISVKLPGGHLKIKADADLSNVWLDGPVRRVFEGRLP